MAFLIIGAPKPTLLDNIANLELNVRSSVGHGDSFSVGRRIRNGESGRGHGGGEEDNTGELHFGVGCESF